MKKIIPVILILFISQNISAQKQEKIELTGNLSHDSFIASQNLSSKKINFSLPAGGKKSPMLGGLMSLIIPGAGEFYAGDYLKAIIFAAVEAAIITTAVIYDGKGDTQTDKFEKFANENWSVKQYAKWTIANLQNPESIIYDEKFNPNDYAVFNPDETVNWSELNRLESTVKLGYSHRLPLYGDQQYYELIGKYPQYSHGWSDANLAETDYHILSPNFLYYSGERGKANDYYNVASKAVIGIYINHFLSALDAVWTVVNHNKDIAVKMRVERVDFANYIEFVPTLKFSYRF